jgi:hypothetical protein
MKKWLTGFCILLLVSVALEYLFIPGNLLIVKIVPVQCNVNSANKFLGSENNWAKWWPDRRSGDSAGGAFTYGGMRFRMGGQFQHVMEVSILLPDSVVQSRISIVPVGDNLDSAILKWDCALNAGLNPVNRIRQYQAAKRVKENMEGILFGLRSFIENKFNVYGLEVHQTSTKDSFLVGIKSVFPVYPTTVDIYALVDKLRKYIGDGGARETDHPMMNVTVMPGKATGLSGKAAGLAAKGADMEQSYQVMVAIPENKDLRATETIFTRKMTPGRYLVADVKGGQETVKAALGQMQDYATDYQRTSMAIPFQSLLTDRSVERDTTKWVTRIYYPVY